MERKHASDHDQELLDLYDGYAHSQINRRDFLSGAAKFAVGGVTAAALLDSLSPNDEAAATLAWQRTIDFFNETLH
jgi:carboxymethylenebutenolidase